MITELSERIRRNTHSDLDGWAVRLFAEAADEIERQRELLAEAAGLISLLAPSEDTATNREARRFLAKFSEQNS